MYLYIYTLPHKDFTQTYQNQSKRTNPLIRIFVPIPLPSSPSRISYCTSYLATIRSHLPSPLSTTLCFSLRSVSPALLNIEQEILPRIIVRGWWVEWEGSVVVISKFTLPLYPCFIYLLLLIDHGISKVCVNTTDGFDLTGTRFPDLRLWFDIVWVASWRSERKISRRYILQVWDC